MKVKDYILEEALGYLVTKANRELNLTLFRNFKIANIDVTPEQWGVIVHLWKKDGITQQVLGEFTGRDNPGMTRIIDNMEKKNLVERIAEKNDRRVNLIHLTPKGKELQEELIKQAIKTLDIAAKNISKSDMETCKKVLKMVYKNLTTE